MSQIDQSMREVKCPYCSATYKIPSTVSYATCPYCGTTFRIDKPGEEVEHYLFKAIYDESRAYKLVKAFAVMQAGAARDIEAAASYVAGRYYYLPLYSFNISIIAKCPGENIEGDGDNVYMNVHGGEDVRQYVIPALKNPPIPIPENYRFSARFKEYFKPVILRNGTYLQPDVDPGVILEELKAPSIEEARREAMDACPGSKITIEDHSKFAGLYHYPFIEITYRYNNEDYRAVVDATDGTVVYMEYPIDRRRALKETAGLMAIVALSGVIGLLASSSVIGLYMGLAAAAPPSLLQVFKLMRHRAVYMFKPSEEASFLPVR